MNAKRILIVDDESDICFVLEKALGAFMIDSYEDPLLALENFKPHSYNGISRWRLKRCLVIGMLA